MSVALFLPGRATMGARGARACSGALLQSTPSPPSSLSPPSPPSVDYPPIEDITPTAKWRKSIKAWHTEVRRCRTVEEKIIKINMPKYYGWKSVILKNGELPVQSLVPIQHATKTQLVVKDALPNFYLPLAAAAEYHAKCLRPKIEETIAIEYQGIKRNFTYEKNISIKKQNDLFLSKLFLRQLNRVLMNYLSNNIPHLMESQVDLEPRLEAFWFVGGMAPPHNVVIGRLKKSHRDNANTPVDRAYQYIGKPVLTVRSEFPLEPLVSDDDLKGIEYDVPFNKYAPEVQDFQFNQRFGTNIPGFWPGDKRQFGLLSFYTREYLIDSPDSYSAEENVENLHSNGIVSSYAWLLAQACYQGFSTYNELTYPMTTQTVITNGQYWSFYAYQMNTVLMTGDHAGDKSRSNICYATNPMKLFDGIDADGKVVGFDENVFKVLLQFYLNSSQEREGVRMQPNLRRGLHVVADYRGPERREWLEKQFKHLSSNRHRQRPVPEVYDWERIYKIKHKTRFMEKRMRPFELNINPYQRRLDEHTKEYIPRALRVGKFAKMKFRNTYYP